MVNCPPQRLFNVDLGLLKKIKEWTGNLWLQNWSDLQLDVKGCKNVYESFDKYVEVEKMEGDNKYHAEHYGLQVVISLLRSLYYF